MNRSLRLAGALLSPPDSRDLVFEHIASGKRSKILPKVVILDSKARDQGLRPTCAAFAGATISTIIEGCEMAPEFIYFNRCNKPGEGMYGRNVCQILKKQGIPLESEYPYGSTEPPTEEILKAARKHRVKGYYRITSIEGVKDSIADGRPVLAILPVRNMSIDKFWDGDVISDLHAVTIVGYNVDSFVIQNSWSYDWNSDGSVLLDFSEFPRTLR
eukprot:TRINITY_DN178_c0_g1_i5.p1 TRINITY_DN178_c0_g1~~TRINITY_DN178_c0_g1_i5.p1  ORF type:complete len:215 (+),score=23.03 TRINITY_DN178_c0_g1_i5:69-713(+)